MPVTDTTEKRFESDIESFFLSEAGGYTKYDDTYDSKLGLLDSCYSVRNSIFRSKPVGFSSGL